MIRVIVHLYVCIVVRSDLYPCVCISSFYLSNFCFYYDMHTYSHQSWDAFVFNGTVEAARSCEAKATAQFLHFKDKKQPEKGVKQDPQVFFFFFFFLAR
jgi:hypothetical protein